MKKGFLLTLILVLSLLLLAACGTESQPAPADTPETPDPAEETGKIEPVTLVLTGGTSSGNWYSQLSTLATYWSQLDCIKNISVTTSSGAPETTSFFANGDVNVCVTSGQCVSHMLSGEGIYPEAWDGEFQALMYGALTPQQFVVDDDSSMKYVSDLAGHSLTDGQAGSGITVVNHDVWKYLDDMSYDQLSRVENMASSEGLTQLQNGKIDCVLFMYSLPHTGTVAMAEEFPIKLLSYTQEQMDAMLENVDYAMAQTIPAGTYKGMTEDVLTLTDSSYVCISTDIPDEVIYEMVKIIYENWDEICQINALFKDWSFVWGMDGEPFVPLADGAIQYYKEVGLL